MKAICEGHQLVAGLGPLSCLAEAYDGDMRAALLALQFLLRKDGYHISADNVRASALAAKEGKISSFGACEELLLQVDPKKAALSHYGSGGSGIRLRAAMDAAAFAHTIQQSHGSLSALTHTLYANFLQPSIRHLDPTMSKAAAVLDAFSLSDCTTEKYAFLPLAVVRRHFRSASRPQLQYSAEPYAMEKARRLYREYAKDIGESWRTVSDRVEYLNACLVPLIVSCSSLSSSTLSHRQLLRNLGEELVKANVHTRQAINSDSMTLVPPLLEMSCCAQPLAVVASTMIVQRLSRDMVSVRLQQHREFKSKEALYSPSKDIQPSQASSQPTPTQRIEIRNMFGQVVSTITPENKKNRRLRSGCSLVYKFYEGYTNAIRKTVLVSDLL